MDLDGRYYGDIITDTAGFEAFWATISAPYASTSTFQSNICPHEEQY